MTYTVIVCKNGRDYVYKQVRRFWAESLESIVIDVGDYHLTVKDYDGLIVKRDNVAHNLH